MKSSRKLCTQTCVSLIATCTFSGIASGQNYDLSPILGAGSGEASARILQAVILISVLSVAPSLIMMVTCFTRFIIVFSFLRSGLGLQSTPSNTVLVGLSIFMTTFVMSPTFEESWRNGMLPLSQNRLVIEEALPKITEPFGRFMQSNVGEKDLELILGLAKARITNGAPLNSEDLRVIVPAFMISELRRSFEIGFLVILPFMIIDVVVSSVIMSMGMMMLSPQVFSLPIKILFFVLIDGWGMLVTSLVKSFR